MTIFSKLKRKFKSIVSHFQSKVHGLLEMRMGDISDALRRRIKNLINIFKLLLFLSWFFIKYTIMYSIIGKDETEMMCEAFREEAHEVFIKHIQSKSHRPFELVIVLQMLILTWLVTGLIYRWEFYHLRAIGGGEFAEIVSHMYFVGITKAVIVCYVVIFLSGVWYRYEKKKEKK